MNRININTLKAIEAEFGEFDIDQTISDNREVYLRFGYWKKINIDKLQFILSPFNSVIEDEYYDDDCGYKFSYKLI
jgi:hypothetical protein